VTRSADLLARAAAEIEAGRNLRQRLAECSSPTAAAIVGDLVDVLEELAREYRVAVAQGLATERALHALTKEAGR
jgi:hypothetical protein